MVYFPYLWGAFAGLYHHYGIKKYYEPKKVFGVYKHHLNVKHEKLFRGFDDEFYVPHSRHIGMKREDIEKAAAIYTAQADDFDYAEVRDVKQAFVNGAEWMKKVFFVDKCRRTFAGRRTAYFSRILVLL